MTSSRFEARRPYQRPLDAMDIPDEIRVLVRAWMYIRGPIVLYQGSPLSTARTLFPMTDAEERMMPDPLREYLVNAEKRLVEQGFDAPVRGVSRIASNVETFTSLLEHRQDGALATIIVMRTKKLARLIGTAMFHSGFADGTILVTSNSRTSRRKPPQPQYRSIRFPDIDEPAELYDVHRFRVQEHGRIGVRVPMTRGTDPFAYQEKESARTFEHWLRCGYYRRESENTLRFTMRGAVLSAWRAMFPWRHLTEAAEARERVAVLERRQAATGKNGTSH